MKNLRLATLLLLVLGKASFVSAAWIKEEQIAKNKKAINNAAIISTFYKSRADIRNLFSKTPLVSDITNIVIDYLAEDESKLKDQILLATKKLLKALEFDDIESMQKILINNPITPSVDWLNGAGNSALMIACQKKYKKEDKIFINLLIKIVQLSLNVDYQDQIYGKTALMRAAVLGNDELVEALVNNGADVDAKDIVTKRTALDMAISACKNDNLIGYNNTIMFLTQKAKKNHTIDERNAFWSKFETDDKEIQENIQAQELELALQQIKELEQIEKEKERKRVQEGEELKRKQEEIKRFHQQELRRKEEQRLEEERLASQRAQKAQDLARTLAESAEEESWNEDVPAEEAEEEGWGELENQD